MNPVFTIENMRPIRDGMTVSRDSRLGTVNKITYFSMGAGTSISQESYDRMTMYLTAAGSGTFLLGEEAKSVFTTPGTALIVPEKTLTCVRAHELNYRKGEHYERKCKNKRSLRTEGFNFL